MITRTFSDIVAEVGLTGKYKGKDAKRFNLMGRRLPAAFATDVTNWHDLVEFSLLSVVNLNRSIYYPTANEAVTVSSTSASDAIAGVGAQKVTVNYLNSSYDLKTVSVDLNGTTPVSVASDVFRVLMMVVTQVGTSSYAVGNIILTAPGSQQIEQISAGSNRSSSARFTVPAGYRAFVFDQIYSTNGNSCEYRMRNNYDMFNGVLLPARTWIETDSIIAGSGAVSCNNGEPLVFEEAVDFKISALAIGTAASPRYNAEVVFIKK
jgi:hypothetical protein